MISHSQRALIRTSFAEVRANQDVAGELFYRHLFAVAPGLLPLFDGTSIVTQAAKLMHVLGYLVDHLDEWASVTATLEQLGARHVAYGVQSDHYAPAGAALVATLRAILGRRFSEDVEDAWTEFYSHVSLLMERGARDAASLL